MSTPNLQRYVILSTPRSGSSHLVGALEAHPEVACLGEIFNTHGGALKRLGHYNEQMMTMLAERPIDYLYRLMEIWGTGAEARKLFGFKMMLHHDELRRENVLAQWSSLQIAKITGEWSSKGKKRRAEKGIAEPDTPRIEFKPKAFEAYCAKLASRYDAIKQRVAGHLLFEVTTERIDERRDEMLAFLGVDPRFAAPSPGAGERQNSATLEERFSNHEALRHYARQHHLELRA